MSAKPYEGGCLCGAVRYRCTAEPAGSMVCHCRTCRRLSEAPVMAWLSLPVGSYELIKGAPASFNSSPKVTRAFCGQCGTHLSYMDADEPEWLDVTTCSLDAPEAFPPTHHSWLSHDIDWLIFGDGLPQFQISRYGGEG